MGSCIVKLTPKDGREPKYVIWSTIVDAPTSRAMSVKDLKKHVARVQPENVYSFEHRMERVEKIGHSMITGESLEDLLNNNRAGNGEKKLTVDEIYDRYK